ncbi:MAG: hypothetical protein EX285_05315 [Thaumarchaeota archaeon]|nr:hypothetical protein [Nitrososphaerota archaeon]
MRTVSSKVNEREYAVIREFANQTGESISNLIHKVLINEAICTYGFGNVPDEYDIDRYPVDTPEEMMDSTLIQGINAVRSCLGWKELDDNGRPKKEDNS